MTSMSPNSCCTMGGAETWPQDSVPRTRLGTTARLRLRLGTTRVKVTKTANNTSKPKVMSFYPLWKIKGTQPTKTPAVHVAHLEEEGSNKERGTESEDPCGIKGVTEEFIMHLARAIKDAQQEEKCCYHCSSPEHFICECPLVKASRTATHLNWKEGMALEKGAQTLQVKVAKLKAPQGGCWRHRASYTGSLLESWSLPPMVWDQKCSQGKD